MEVALINVNFFVDDQARNGLLLSPMRKSGLLVVGREATGGDLFGQWKPNPPLISTDFVGYGARKKLLVS